MNPFKMLDKEMLSIDIGSHSIKLLMGKYERNAVSIMNTITIPTPTDAYYDGEILDMLPLKETLYAALQNNKIKATKAICTMESSSIIIREIDMPTVKPEQMKKMLEFEVEQYLPIEIDQYIIQYKILESFTDGELSKTKVLVTALPKKIAGDYLNLIESVGLKPMVLDIHSNAVDKLTDSSFILNNTSITDKTVAVLDLGHTHINIALIEKGVFKFNRLLKMGGKDITLNICNFLDFNLEEAELKKREIENIAEGLHNFTAAASWIENQEIHHIALEKELEDFPPAARLLNIVKSSLDNWIEEIEKVFKYYTTRTTGNAIDEIYIYGGSANLGGICRYLEEAFNIPTHKIEKISNISLEKNAANMNIASYVNNIGALIRR